MLDLVAKSPRHFLYWRDKSRPKTPAMELGSAAHAGILEPDLFFSRYAVAPKVDRRTKSGKEVVDSWEKMNHDKIPLSQDQFDQVRGMMDAVHAHGFASNLLAKGMAERTVIWDSPFPGIRSKAKIDFLTTSGDLVELKTAQSASPQDFAATVAKRRYFVQVPYYSDGLAAAGLVRASSHVFIVVEPEPPHHVAVYAADDQMLEAGRDEYMRDLATLHRCMTTGDWPGLPEVCQPLSLPPWYRRDIA